MTKKRLSLIECNPNILKTAIKGDKELEKELNIVVCEDWTEFGIEALQYALNKLSESQDEKGWWTYFPIHKKDKKLIGSGGYKGKPNVFGEVEIGYEIAKSYRNQGLGTEMAKELVERAFKQKLVKSVIAHTLGEENSSTKILIKCGFDKIEEIEHPEEGKIWKWRIEKNTYLKTL
ncbi:GNAT family N-acetyltransferase [Bernardetia sp.]|uniref:GNAT family N-acetyltransferase n=1 Tax=Bernardetia sp. TaxID=1937974 RepID=UPI0025C56768|nr:GNAT family N-acetyltransferase [Bernardetia sp.]